ncbi:MAG: hypothetical protein C4516_04985 [Oxalobacter sp.]|nr:MAG: hypothetical protein C4516_04985 [Oxalobacter sp.]
MTVWAVSSITETPEIVLTSWLIAETDKNERHFVGYNLTAGEGRVSSAIMKFDHVKKMGITQSGRVYHLKGNPGQNADAMHTWNTWRAINNVQSWSDVTAQALAEPTNE